MLLLKQTLSFRRRLLIWLALMLLTTVIYGRSFRYGFVNYDDNVVFSDADVPRSLVGEEGRHLWTTPVAGNWQPLVTISFVLDRWGHRLNPRWLHVEDALLHAACGIAVFEFLYRSTRQRGTSACVAALFICAPMHVESVAWLSERKDELAALFMFLSLAANSEYVRRRSIVAYLLAVLGLMLSFLCKPMAVTLPAVLVLLDLWPFDRLFDNAATERRKFRWVVLVEKIPFLILSLVAATVAVGTQTTAGRNAGTAGYLPMSARVANAAVCYVLYLWKLIVPNNLAVFYPHPGARPFTQVLGAVLVLTVVTAMCLRQWKPRPYLLIGWLWFLGTLVPVIGFFQIGGQAMADRYSYIPSVGLFVMIVWGMADALRRFSTSSKAIVATAIIVINAIVAIVQVGYWADTEALFTHALDVTGDNYEADAALGDVAFERHDLATAAGYYTEVIRIAPASSKGYDRLAACVADPARAAKLLRQAVECSPLNVAYRLRLARALDQSGDVEGALQQAKSALQIDPSNGEAKMAVDDLSSRRPS